MPKVKVTDSKGLVQEAGTGVTLSSNIRCTNGSGLKDSRKFRDEGTANAALTAMTAVELSLNTHYASRAAATAMTLPSTSVCDLGDFITVYYDTTITNGADHTFTLHADDTSFATGSYVYRVGGGVASSGYVCDGNDDNILTISGESNGDGGKGTTVHFTVVNPGANTVGVDKRWAAAAVVLNAGNGSVGKNVATAFS